MECVFVKQKTAYEIPKRDWSSDVCSSDLAAKNATRTIPIVMASTGGDPVGAGLVESLARPGGNITGLSQMVPELVGKRLELLREMDPKLSRVAVLWDARDPSATLWKEMQLPARA